MHSILLQLRDGAVGSMNSTKRQNFQEFINDMVSKDKVFTILKPERAGVMSPNNDILKCMYEKTTSWNREHNESVVDMKDINFEVSREILNELFSFSDNDLFKEEFDHFMGYMEHRIEDILLRNQYSFKSIIDLLKRDALEAPDAHSFLSAMQCLN